MIEKYTFDLLVPATAYLSRRAPGEERAPSKNAKKKIILVKSDFESHAHVIMKVLAYLLFYDPRLQIEMSVDMHYKPDLVIQGEHVPELWIDCGKIALKKVESLSDKLKTTRICLIKETKRELDQFRKTVERKVGHPERLEYLAFEPGFVSGLGGALQRSNEVTLYEVLPEVIGVAMNDEVFESALYR